MEWVETTGRSVEEALDAALDELGVHEEDVEFEVLAKAKAGFLGRFGGTEARIRTRLKPISREKPGDQRRRKSKGGRSRVNTGASGGDRRSERESRPARGRRSNERPARPGDETSRETKMDEMTAVPVERQAEVASDFTSGLVDAFGFDAEVRDALEDDTITITVEGTGLGLLVGPRGATLHAIEELVRAVVQRETGGHGARIHLDVGGYRAKRREALEVFTRGLVDRVLETGKEQVLEPMPSPDRKVVHDVVAEIEGVDTASEGEDPRRFVVIRPA